MSTPQAVNPELTRDAGTRACGDARGESGIALPKSRFHDEAHPRVYDRRACGCKRRWNILGRPIDNFVITHWRALLVILFAAAVLAALALGCEQRDSSSTPLTQPDRLVPMSALLPATAEEWARLQQEMDASAAREARKDREIEALISERNTANKATWERLGMYSWLCLVPGVGVLVGSMLPWLPTLAAFRGMGWSLLGLGFAFGIAPWAIANGGPYALYPIAGTIGLYIASLAGLDIWSRFRKIWAVTVKANAAVDPVETALHLGAAEGIARTLGTAKPQTRQDVKELADIARSEESVTIAATGVVTPVPAGA